MTYLELNLDPFVSLWRELNVSIINPLNLLSYVENSYTGGITFSYKPNRPLFSEISTLRKLTNCRINIRITPDMEKFKKVKDLAPDVITLYNDENEYNIVELPSKTVSKIVNESRAAKIPVILRIAPHIKQLKHVYKLKCSQTELATNRLDAMDTKVKFDKVLTQLSRCYNVAKKNNLRISFGGNLNKRLILALKRLMTPEFYSMGRYILSFSLVKGFENVLEDTVEMIEK